MLYYNHSAERRFEYLAGVLTVRVVPSGGTSAGKQKGTTLMTDNSTSGTEGGRISAKDFRLRPITPEDYAEWEEYLDSPEHLKAESQRQYEEHALLGSKGYEFQAGKPDICEVFETLTDYQRLLLNVFCVIDYVPSHKFTEDDFNGYVVSPSASKIFTALMCRLLSRSFGLTELKAFLIRENVPMRSDWKDRLELLPLEPDAKEEPIPASTRKIINTDNKPVDTSGYFSISDLIARNNIPNNGRFERQMRRWRKDNLMSSDVIEHDAPSKNKARYLFREAAGAIQDIIKMYQEKS